MSVEQVVLADAEPVQHPVIRLLLAAAGIGAIGFACLILAWPAPFVSTSDSTKTTTEPSKTTTVVEKKTTSPSAALVGGVFGVGVLLLLAAALFDRLRELKGPWGIGIALSGEERGKIAAQVTQALREKTGAEPSPEEAARATAAAIGAAEIRLLDSFELRAPLWKPDVASGSGILSIDTRRLSDVDLSQVVDQVVFNWPATEITFPAKREPQAEDEPPTTDEQAATEEPSATQEPPTTDEPPTEDEALTEEDEQRIKDERLGRWIRENQQRELEDEMRRVDDRLEDEELLKERLEYQQRRRDEGLMDEPLIKDTPRFSHEQVNEQPQSEDKA